MFAIQTEIAEAIAERARVPLGLDGAVELVTPTGDLEAYDLYLAGRARLRERGESAAEAIRLFEAAIARDSTWAPAWAGLAEATGDLGSGTRRSWAVRTPDSATDSHGSLARVRARGPAGAGAGPRQRVGARGARQRATRTGCEWEAPSSRYGGAGLDPDNAEAHQQYARAADRRPGDRLCRGRHVAGAVGRLDPRRSDLSLERPRRPTIGRPRRSSDLRGGIVGSTPRIAWESLRQPRGIGRSDGATTRLYRYVARRAPSSVTAT